MTLDFTCPLRTGRGLNDRLSPFARASRVKHERFAIWAVWPRDGYKPIRPTPPLTVHLTRLGPGTRPIDDDNLAGSLKGVRDEVAKQLKVDDGDTARIRFTYSQERGPWSVRIRIESEGP